jgi:hypothetical protein
MSENRLIIAFTGHTGARRSHDTHTALIASFHSGVDRITDGERRKLYDYDNSLIDLTFAASDFFFFDRISTDLSENLSLACDDTAA